GNQVDRNRAVIDSTAAAWEYYRKGNGKTVELGPRTKDALLTSPEQMYRSDRIKTGKTESLSGNYGVDLTRRVYHVGNTTVQYETVCNDVTCTTTYIGFTRNKLEGGYGPDGFWDIVGGNDTIGPEGEVLGGKPYPYSSYRWKETYPNPYR